MLDESQLDEFLDEFFGEEKPASDAYKSIVNNALSYRVGAVYEPTEALSLFASMGSFFKPNNTVYTDNYIYLDKNGQRYHPEDGGEVFAPEKGWQFETTSDTEVILLSFLHEGTDFVRKLDGIFSFAIYIDI